VSSALEGLVDPGERSPFFAGLGRQKAVPRIDFFAPVGPYQVTQSPYPYTQLDLTGAPPTTATVTTGQSEGYEAALAEARKRAADFSDPMNTIEAAAGHVGVALSNNYSPPFIMYEVQSYYGWTDAQMKAAGYVRGIGGWMLDVGDEDLPTSTGSVEDESGGGGASWSFPASNSRNSFRGSSLVNWRI
jgi:hypothetical protein